jgi:multiple sugar transport system ATP-binding protein
MQVGTPRALYDHPDNVFVAGFIGSPAMNLLDLTVIDGGVQLGDTVWPVERSLLSGAGGKVTVGMRPEDLQITEHGLAVEVDVVEELGADAYIYGHLLGIGDDRLDIIARTDGRRPPEKGATIHFAPKADHVHLFDTENGQRLGG